MKIALLCAVAAVALTSCASSGTEHPSGPPCTTGLPPAWKHELGSARLSLDHPAEPLAVASDGTLYARSAGPGGDNREVIAIDSTGSARTVYTVPAGLGQVSVSAYPVDTGRLVVVLSLVPGALIPRTGSPQPSGRPNLPAVDAAVVAVDVVDPASGDTRRLAGMSADETRTGDNLIEGVAVLAGHVYWNLRPHSTSRSGTIVDYDLMRDRIRTLFTGSVGPPELTAAGVSWGTGRVPAPLAPAVARALPESATVVTDRTAYAWAAGSGSISWIAADGTGLVDRPQSAVATPFLLAVGGHFVFFDGYDDTDQVFVMDVRSGATARTGLDAPGLRIDGAGTVVLGSSLYQTTAAEPIVRIDTAGLPALHC